eukprot:ctg_663.g280
MGYRRRRRLTSPVEYQVVYHDSPPRRLRRNPPPPHIPLTPPHLPRSTHSLSLRPPPDASDTRPPVTVSNARRRARGRFLLQLGSPRRSLHPVSPFDTPAREAPCAGDVVSAENERRRWGERQRSGSDCRPPQPDGRRGAGNGSHPPHRRQRGDALAGARAGVGSSGASQCRQRPQQRRVLHLSALCRTVRLAAGHGGPVGAEPAAPTGRRAAPPQRRIRIGHRADATAAGAGRARAVAATAAAAAGGAAASPAARRPGADVAPFAARCQRPGTVTRTPDRHAGRGAHPARTDTGVGGAAGRGALHRRHVRHPFRPCRAVAGVRRTTARLAAAYARGAHPTTGGGARRRGRQGPSGVPHGGAGAGARPARPGTPGGEGSGRPVGVLVAAAESAGVLLAAPPAGWPGYRTGRGERGGYPRAQSGRIGTRQRLHRPFATHPPATPARRPTTTTTASAARAAAPLSPPAARAQPHPHARHHQAGADHQRRAVQQPRAHGHRHRLGIDASHPDIAAHAGGRCRYRRRRPDHPVVPPQPPLRRHLPVRLPLSAHPVPYYGGRCGHATGGAGGAVAHADAARVYGGAAGGARNGGPPRHLDAGRTGGVLGGGRGHRHSARHCGQQEELEDTAFGHGGRHASDGDSGALAATAAATAGVDGSDRGRRRDCAALAAGGDVIDAATTTLAADRPR